MTAPMPNTFNPDEYARFIAGLELREIRLVRANVEGPEMGAGTEIGHLSVHADADLITTDAGFVALHDYTVSAHTPNGAETLTLKALFALDFASAQRPGKETCDVFGEVNLPVNTWPYLREFVSSMFARMGWPTVTLPAYKVGIDEREEADAAATVVTES